MPVPQIVIHLAYCPSSTKGIPVEYPYIVNDGGMGKMFRTAREAVEEIDRLLSMRMCTLSASQEQQNLYGFFQGMAAEEA